MTTAKVRAPEIENMYRLWLNDTVPGDGDGTGRYLAATATLEEADELGQRLADYHGGTVVAYPPKDRYLIGDRYYQPAPRCDGDAYGDGYPGTRYFHKSPGCPGHD